jgi:uncharacterized protein
MRAACKAADTDSVYPRVDVEFFSKTGTCKAWIFRPRGAADAPAPCVVMAHGLGGTRDAGLEPYAQRFASAGYVVVLFDYRHFGASSGEPRQLFSIRRQLQDWASAIAFARRLEGVDRTRIALWGTSFSGGHVIVAAARDGEIAAISAQCPMTDALAALRSYIRHAGIGTFLKLGVYGMIDQVRAMLGWSPVHVPIIGRPGELAAMCSPDAVAGYGAITPPQWRNQICARFALTISGYRPVAYVRKLGCPMLIQVCLHDNLAPASAAIAAVHKMGVKAELKRYDCDHFDIYVGANFERAIGEQLAFFDRVLSVSGDGADRRVNATAENRRLDLP